LTHDLWVIPGKFVIEPGEKVRVFLHSGDRFPNSTALLSKRRIESFILHGPSTESPVSAFVAEGDSLTAEIAGPESGTAVLALAIKPRVIRLKADEFNEYLEEDGLPRILELRKRLGETNHSAVERYAKWAKAILKVGDREDDTWSKPIGLKLEIVPRRNPYTLRPGESSPVVVLFDGEPLPGVTVVGGRAGPSSRRVKSVTDSDGEASLVLEEPGRWYLSAIHMIRLPDDPEAEWESFWATVTFEVLP
jgi:hypothetical protein